MPIICIIPAKIAAGAGAATELIMYVAGPTALSVLPLRLPIASKV
jgi:hypothetical protein